MCCNGSARNRRRARVPVASLTSSSESADVSRAYDLGANAYLLKPVEFEGPSEMLRNLGICRRSTMWARSRASLMAAMRPAPQLSFAAKPRLTPGRAIIAAYQR